MDNEKALELPHTETIPRGINSNWWKISRPSYDKPHRCPGRAGPGTKSIFQTRAGKPTCENGYLEWSKLKFLQKCDYCGIKVIDPLITTIFPSNIIYALSQIPDNIKWRAYDCLAAQTEKTALKLEKHLKTFSIPSTPDLAKLSERLAFDGFKLTKNPKKYKYITENLAEFLQELKLPRDVISAIVSQNATNKTKVIYYQDLSLIQRILNHISGDYFRTES